jgi:hypothetical protein
MIRTPEMRTPAPRANAENRAKVIRNNSLHTIARPEPEGVFAAEYLARWFGLSAALAWLVAALAAIGGRRA